MKLRLIENDGEAEQLLVRSARLNNMLGATTGGDPNKMTEILMHAVLLLHTQAPPKWKDECEEYVASVLEQMKSRLS